MGHLAQRLAADLAAGRLLADLREDPLFDAGKMYAIGNLSAANSFATQSGGGEIGLTSGFGAVIGLRLNKLGGAARHLLNRCNGIVNGWVPYINADRIQAWFGNGTNSFVTPYYQLVASDIGKLITFAIWLDGTKARLAVSRAQIGDGTAFTGTFAPYTGPTVFSGLASNVATGPATDVDLLVQGTFRGVPTQTQLEALFDLVRQKGDLPTPAEWPYGISHGWSLREELAKAGVPVIDGQLAPASVADTVTAATIDRMDRQGSPTVKIIDPSVDGRKSYGALGFSASSVLQSAAGASFRGSPGGFTVRVPVTFWSIAAGVEYFASCATPGVGWSFQRNGATLTFYIGNGSAVGATKTLTASDLGIPHLLHLVYNGTAVEGFFDGTSVGVSAPGGYAAAAGTIPVTIGALGLTAANPATTVSVHALSGANHVATAGEVTADFAAWQRTARLSDISGKPDANRYELSLDVIANGGPENGIPLQVLDRIGTDHLTRVGGLQVNSAGGIAGLTKWGPSGTASTKVGGGVEGIGTGFFRAFDLVLGTITQVNGLFGKGDTATKGDYFRVTAAGLQWVVCDAGGAARSLILPLVAADVTTRQRCVLHHDGSTIRIYLGTFGNTISTACSGFTPYTGAMVLGDLFSNGSSALGVTTAHGFQSGHAVLSAGEISALLADTSFAPIAGKTSYRVWIPDDIAEAGGKVPGRLKERIAGVDNMVIVGSPLQVAQRAERLWSYEAA